MYLTVSINRARQSAKIQVFLIVKLQIATKPVRILSILSTNIFVTLLRLEHRLLQALSYCRYSP